MIVSHNLFIKAFKRDAALLLSQHIPGKLHIARQDINIFLRKEARQLRRWHSGLLLRIITSEEFAKLFKGLRNALQLKKLKAAGLPEQQLLELTDLLRKLFRAMMITYTQDHKLN